MSATHVFKNDSFARIECTIRDDVVDKQYRAIVQHRGDKAIFSVCGDSKFESLGAAIMWALQRARPEAVVLIRTESLANGETFHEGTI